MALQDEFRARHPEWQHCDVPFSNAQAARLVATWRAMLDSQNGRDVDDCAPGTLTSFLRGVPELAPPGRLLIIGAGTGVELAEARTLGWDAVGTTLGPMNVAVAAERGISIDFGDFHTSAYPTGSFDAIVARQVWEHSWSPFMFAIECARALRPGGRVALETPNCEEFIYASDVIHHVFCPTPFQGARLLEKAGFVDVAVYDGTRGGARFDGESAHRDDVGGGSLMFTGTRWTQADAERVNPLVRQLTSQSIDAAVSAPATSDRTQAIAAIYREELGREPDAAGLKHYVGSALDVGAIRAVICSSDEARAKRGER